MADSMFPVTGSGSAHKRVFACVFIYSGRAPHRDSCTFLQLSGCLTAFSSASSAEQCKNHRALNVKSPRRTIRQENDAERGEKANREFSLWPSPDLNQATAGVSLKEACVATVCAYLWAVARRPSLPAKYSI